MDDVSHRAETHNQQAFERWPLGRSRSFGGHAASPTTRSKTGANNLARRMILGIAHDRHTPTASLHFVSLRDALGRVVGAFGLKVGADFADDGAHVVLGKDDNRVHVGESREYFRTLFSRHQRTPGALESTHRLVRIYRHH